MRIIKSFTLIILIGIATAGVVVNPAKSEVLRFSYEGIITIITDETGQLNQAGIEMNTTFFGEFEYDTLAPATVFGDTASYTGNFFNIGFNPADPILITGLAPGVLVTLGGTSSDRLLLDGNNATSDELIYTESLSIGMKLVDLTNTTFTSTALPVQLDLVAFSTHKITFTGVGFRSDGECCFRDFFQGNITSISSPTIIPLPAALPLFLTGLAGLALIRRRRRQA